MTDSSTSYEQAVKKTHTRLKTNALNFWEVLAQAVALISPSMTAALIVPLMFGTAGTAGWLCYLFGTIMLLFVAISLNQFSKRYTSAGSMYEYTVKGLGPKVGGMSGWCLIFAYMFIGIAGVTGFTHFATKLLNLTGVSGYLSHPYITLFAICVAAAWFLAYKDITFSTILMLIFEGISVALIVMLAFLALGKTGLIDHAQLHPVGHGLKDIGLGVVVAIFSLVGFECATAFGEEARSPLKTIPRAVIASLLLTGGFFVFITYVETHALAGNVPTLDQLDAPLNTLSANLGVKWMGVLISLGAMISFFALALSCMNAGSRVLFTMGRYGIFPLSVGSSHKDNLTPHVAITSFAAIQFLIPTTFILLSYGAVGGWQMAPFDAFNDAGLFGAMGFCGAYVLISLATPFYLKKIGELKPYNIAIAVIALALLAVPIVGTVYPVPAAPLNYFPYIFLTYVLAGAILVSVRSRSHSEIEGIRKVLEETTTMTPTAAIAAEALVPETQFRAAAGGSV
ncbi:MAG TPA: APC family permease [Candidatus Acidoferrales bacterium]|jgi:amino acid transporter|nr:APC family permease [Candidatus Acidoferrales bacterium]